MTIKVSDVMRHVRNFFITDAIRGDFSMTGGMLAPAEHFAPGMWIAIPATPGALAGVYQLDDRGGIPDLSDAMWTGTVYRLNPPADFLHLCGDIGCWAAANPDVSVTGEKLGQYSVTRRAVPWQQAFAPALAPYQRMFSEVAV